MVGREHLFEVVKSVLRRVVPELKDVEIREEHKMTDLGADSLQIIEVVSRCMKETRIKVPRTELAGAQNIGGLLDLFEKHQANQPPTAAAV
jgi:polyketide biosynthesis acyl carrier protein